MIRGIDYLGLQVKANGRRFLLSKEYGDRVRVLIFFGWQAAVTDRLQKPFFFFLA